MLRYSQLKVQINFIFRIYYNFIYMYHMLKKLIVLRFMNAI